MDEASSIRTPIRQSDSRLAVVGRLYETVAYKFVMELDYLVRDNRDISDYPEVAPPSSQSGITRSIVRLILEIVSNYLLQASYHSEANAILCHLRTLRNYGFNRKVNFVNGLVNNTAENFVSSANPYDCFGYLSFISELIFGLWTTPEHDLVPYVIEATAGILIQKYNWRSVNDVEFLDIFAKLWLNQYMPCFTYVPLGNQLRDRFYYLERYGR